MKKQLVLTAVLLLAVTPAFAQRAGDVFGGELGPEYARGITDKLERMGLDQGLEDRSVLEQFYSAQQLDQFFENTVVRVSFYPDGSYVAYARRGGEIAELKIGKKDISPQSDSWESDRWMLRTGQFSTPKRASQIKMKLSAGGGAIPVDCLNKFKGSDQTVTFYVGPMNGLMCIGLVDEEALPFDEVVQTADGKTAKLASAPGS